MSAFSNYVEIKTLDHILRGIPYEAPTDVSSVWVALFLNNPEEDASGMELADSNYSRQDVRQDLEKLEDAQTAPLGSPQIFLQCSL